MAPKNVIVNSINKHLLQKYTGEISIYKSTFIDQNEIVRYPIELFNSLDVPGMPPRMLKLKVETSVTFFRNLNLSKFCNGTKFILKAPQAYVIEEQVFFHSPYLLITFELPFHFKRL